MNCPLCHGDGKVDEITLSQPITKHLINYNRVLDENTILLRELTYLRDRNNETVRRGGYRRKKRKNVTLKKKKK